MSATTRLVAVIRKHSYDDPLCAIALKQIRYAPEKTAEILAAAFENMIDSREVLRKMVIQHELTAPPKPYIVDHKYIGPIFFHGSRYRYDGPAGGESCSTV